jgi:hypothetical protein
LEKAKLNEDTASLRKELFYISRQQFLTKVMTDDLKVIFWENIYNAFLLIMLKEQIQPKNILKQKRIKIAYFNLSLNDIEYGILKKPKFKIGLHRINTLFYSSYIKRMAVIETDVSGTARLEKKVLNQTI